MKHPSIEKLALYEGGELSWWDRINLRRHVSRCAQCQAEVALFRNAAVAAREENEEMPAGVQWDRLAAEMRANIHVGIAASDAISSYSKPVEAGPVQGLSWRMAVLTSGVVLMVTVGYWLNAAKKSEQIAAMRPPDPVVAEASERGVGMSDGSKELVLQGPKANVRAAIMTVSTVGSAGARYVDEDTGQITVNNVYVE